MAFFNFIDTVGPPVPAAFLNALDNIQNILVANQQGFMTVKGNASAVLGNAHFQAGSRTSPIPDQAFFDVFCSAATGIVVWTGHNVSNSPNASVTGFIVGNDQAPAGPTVGPTVFFSSTLTSSTWNTSVFANVPTGPLAIFQSSSYPMVFAAGSPTLANMVLTGGVSTTQLQVAGAGVGTTNLIDMTPDTGTFSANLSGMTAAVPVTVSYERIGRKVRLWTTATATGTSNATTMSMDGIPVSLQPAANQGTIVFPFEDNGTNNIMGSGFIVGSQIFFGRLTTASGAIGSSAFTASGTKGVIAGWSFTYSL